MLKNAIGGTIEGHWERWKWRSQTAYIADYVTSGDECFGQLTTDAYERGVERLRDSAAAKAAGSF